eukprot:7101304-Karenia_brevis.AAC.1
MQCRWSESLYLALTNHQHWNGKGNQPRKWESTSHQSRMSLRNALRGGPSTIQMNLGGSHGLLLKIIPLEFVTWNGRAVFPAKYHRSKVAYMSKLIRPNAI